MKALFLKIIICLLVSPLGSIVVGYPQNPQSNESPDLLESRQLNSSVMKLYAEGKYDEALPLAKRALELREKALGPDHEDVIPLLLNLGELYRLKKKQGNAKAYYERALAVGEKAFGPDDLRITRLLDKLAFAAFADREEKRAENLFERSLTIRQKAGREDRELALTASTLAEIYRVSGDYKKAEPLFQLAIRILENMPGKDRSDLITALNRYATLLFVTSRTDEGTLLEKRIGELSDASGVIQGGVLNGRAIKLVTPSYPALARSDHASGTVQVRVLINETGSVIQAQAMNTGGIHLALVAAAEEAARRSRFTPTLLAGMPVKVNGIIIYRFIAQ